MNVRQAMTKTVVAVKPRDSVVHARALLEKHRINQLPVLVDGRLVGIVTDRDLRDAFPQMLPIPGRLGGGKRFRELEGVNVEDVMTRNVACVTPETTVLEAVEILRRERIGALPVVAEERVVGIMSRSDVLDAYATIARRLGENHDTRAKHPHTGDARSLARPG